MATHRVGTTNWTGAPARPVQSPAAQVSAGHAFTSVAQRLTTYICYAEVFGDALTLDELVQRCGPDQAASVRAALTALVEAGRIVQHGEFYVLPGQPWRDHAARRRRGRELAEAVMRANRRLLGALARFPFVRLVAVSGSVAAASPGTDAEEAPDCDLFVIAADDSLQIVRLALRALMKAGEVVPRTGLMSAVYKPCPNFMVEESSSAIENESFYTATESLQVVVLKGQDAYHEFLSRNRWISRYYAGPWTAIDRHREEGNERRPWLRRWALGAVNAGCFAALCCASWMKSRLLGTDFSYSLRPTFDRQYSLRLSRPVAGGYQVTVRNRFADLYRAHFSELCSEEYLEFLFPRTSATGIWVDGHLFSPPARLSLDRYDGLLSARR